MSLEATLDARVDGAVEFEFSVHNAGDSPVELSFRSGKIADVAVFDDGEEVWRWSDGRMFTQALGTETLAPGESFTHEATWEDPPAGEYTAEATLAADVELAVRESFAVG